MARSATDPKTEAAWLAAFGDPIRLTILRFLASGEKIVTQLAKECQVEMANISHHLGLLKDVGLVTVERDGRFMRYSLVGVKATANALEMTHESGAKVIIPLN